MHAHTYTHTLYMLHSTVHGTHKLVHIHVTAHHAANSLTLKRTQSHTFTLTQLLDLLKRLGLGQYTGTFTKEGITGELLLECDDDLLKNELAVSQKLHRLKIIKLINGKTNIT